MEDKSFPIEMGDGEDCLLAKPFLPDSHLHLIYYCGDRKLKDDKWIRILSPKAILKDNFLHAPLPSSTRQYHPTKKLTQTIIGAAG